MNSKPPARRRSCLKLQNANAESDTSDGTGLIEKDDTGTISLPRKRVSFSHKKEIKEFQSLSIDAQDHSPMEMTVQQQSSQHIKININDGGVDENVVPVVDMSMTYTLPMSEGTFIVDSTFTKGRKTSLIRRRRSKIQNETFIIQDSSHHNQSQNNYEDHNYLNPENDMSMSRVVLENENVQPSSTILDHQYQQQQKQQFHPEQKSATEEQQEKQLINQFNSTNIEQPNQYGVSPDMSLTISGESPPVIPSEFQTNPNVLVYPHDVDLNYMNKQQQQYEEEPQIPEISMMMESMAVKNTIEYNNHHNPYQIQREINSISSNNNNNMSMTVDLNPSKIPNNYYLNYQDPQPTRRDERDMSITMNENDASPLDKTGFYYETYEAEEEEEEKEEEGVNSRHPNHTQYYPNTSMTMDLDSLIKLSSTQIKLQENVQEYSDMSITMAVPTVASLSQQQQQNNIHMNQTPIVMPQRHVSNICSTINDEKDDDDERAEKRRRQTYTIVQGNEMDDHQHYVFKAPIPTNILSSQNQNYKNKFEMRKSTVPVPENSAFGRFGSVKTPRRKLPDDISSMILTQPKEQPRTSSVTTVRDKEKQQQIQQKIEVVQNSSFSITSATTSTSTTSITPSDQISSSSSMEIQNKHIDIIPPEIMRSNSTVILGIDITMNVEPYIEHQSNNDTQTMTLCSNESKISTQAVEKMENNHLHSSSSNVQSINYSNNNFNKSQNSWTSTPSNIPQQNTLNSFKIPIVQTSQTHVANIRKISIDQVQLKESKECNEKQKIIFESSCEVRGHHQQQKFNPCTTTKGKKHVNTLEDKIVQLKLLKGLRLQRALAHFSRDLQSVNDSKFSKIISEITGFVNPDFIQTEVKIREYEAIMKTKEFPTDPEDQLFIFAKRKLAELYGDNLDETF